MKADPKQTYVSSEWKHTAPLIACRFDPQGRYVFTSSEDYSVQRWELPSGKLMARHPVPIRGYDFRAELSANAGRTRVEPRDAILRAWMPKVYLGVGGSASPRGAG